MTTVEPGIYRIVNYGRGTVMTVPAHSNSMIVGRKTPNQPGQQWFIRRSGGGYHISDRVYGRYIAVDRAKPPITAYLEDHPTFWEIIPDEETTWKIKLMEYDLVLDLRAGNNGEKIQLERIQSGYDGSRWELERLGSAPGRFGAK